MNQKAIIQFLFPVIAVFIISSCNNSQDNSTNSTVSNEKSVQKSEYDWTDEYIVSFSDVHNPMNGYASDDPEALDTTFINVLFNEILKREDVEFLDQAEEKKITAQQVKEELTEMGFDINTMGRKDIVAVICREKWQFDKKALKLQKTVTHIAPIARTYDSEGNERGKIKLFWIKLN